MPPSIRRAYPTMPASCWWPLRERFKRSMPSTVDTTYLREVLGIETKTARNLIPMLREMSLIDAAGRPLDRAFHWRVDGEYPAICRRIRDEIYPAALRVSVPDPSKDFAGCYHWFLTNTGVGEAAARRMARFYVLLSQAVPLRAHVAAGSGRASRSGTEGNGLAPRRHATRSIRPDSAANGAPYASDGRPEREPATEGHEPLSERADSERSADSIRVGTIDGGVPFVLQLQLTAETTPEQIDQVFASIARHLGPALARRTKGKG